MVGRSDGKLIHFESLFGVKVLRDERRKDLVLPSWMTQITHTHTHKNLPQKQARQGSLRFLLRMHEAESQGRGWAVKRQFKQPSLP